MTLSVGDIAPAFELTNSFGESRSLAGTAGWRLVWWIPSTLVEHAGGCGDRIATSFGSHNDPRLAIFGMTFDPKSLTSEFVRRNFIDFPLLTADVETGKDYGVYRGDEDEWNCFPRKRAFLVDPHGRVAKVYKNIDPDLFVHEVIADLDELAPQQPTGFFGRVLASLKG